MGEASTKLVALEQIVSERSAASSFAAELGTIARALDGVGAAAAAADAVEIAGAELAPSEAPGAVDARVDVLVDRVLEHRDAQAANGKVRVYAGLLGCDVAQGFLLSRPLPAEACELMLREGRALVELQAA